MKEDDYLCLTTSIQVFLCKYGERTRYFLGALILVMQRFPVVYHVMSHLSLVFSRYTYEPYTLKKQWAMQSVRHTRRLFFC